LIASNVVVPADLPPVVGRRGIPLPVAGLDRSGSVDFHQVERAGGLSSSGRVAHSFISSITLSVIRLIVSRLTLAP